jgi:hypothetical protein
MQSKGLEKIIDIDPHLLQIQMISDKSRIF